MWSLPRTLSGPARETVPTNLSVQEIVGQLSWMQQQGKTWMRSAGHGILLKTREKTLRGHQLLLWKLLRDEPRPAAMAEWGGQPSGRRPGPQRSQRNHCFSCWHCTWAWPRSAGPSALGTARPPTDLGGGHSATMIADTQAGGIMPQNFFKIMRD